MMKQKKIIVPILTLAVMLLMVGGVYAVFSSTQPEKSKAENVRDTTDQDYEKGLTEEQKAFNELINKQIYEETANNLEQYEQYGLTYNSNENQLFFNGKSVCYFADNRATDGTFEGTEVHSANGDICLLYTSWSMPWSARKAWLWLWNPAALRAGCKGQSLFECLFGPWTSFS